MQPRFALTPKARRYLARATRTAAQVDRRDRKAAPRTERRAAR